MTTDQLAPGNIFTQHIHAAWLHENNVILDVLRLDAIHPIVSGNKWFKLKYYLQEAQQNNASVIGSFGGAYSNHILALAYTCKASGIKSIGIIRGEQPAVLSQTLTNAKDCGMELFFVSREAYRNPALIMNDYKNVYWVNEGGYGMQGAKGAADILSYAKHAQQYAHIICAAGTGTMMAGIIRSAYSHQTVTGISVMKGNTELHEKVNALLDAQTKNKSFSIAQQYHFGGYAKHPQELTMFMNEVWQQHQLPTDIIYTAKAFYAAKQMIMQNEIKRGSSVLFIHSGGLQGNRSLPKGRLYF